MANNRISNISAWLGIAGFVITIVIFFSAKPYFQDWISTSSSGQEEIPSKGVSEKIPESIRSEIQKTLTQYYQTALSHDCQKLATYFLPVIDIYFTKKNLSSREIVLECREYYKTWPYQNLKMNEQSLKIMALPGGGYQASYDLFYQVKKNAPDEWKDYNLLINVELTNALKIKSMYEYHL